MNRGTAPMLTVVSHSLPPRVSASAIIFSNLLTSYRGKVNAVGGFTLYATADASFTPPCPTEYLSLPRIYPRAYDGLRRRFPSLICRSILCGVRRSLERLRPDVVLATFPYDDLLVATYLAAQDLGIPFYAYMHDLWMETMSPGTARRAFAEKWEPIVLQAAIRVICMTEATQEHYKRKYSIRPDLLPHCIPDECYEGAATALREPEMRRPTVLFVGGVNENFNLDALKMLASASELLPPDYELVYCTSTDAATLDRLGIHSSRLKVMYLPRTEVLELQSKAHVLLAPLSHKNCSQEEVKTLFSTKLLTYMLSGRPIIAFAPEESYHAKSARKNGWGYVVSEDSPTALAEAIVKVVEDKSLASSLVEGALKEAQTRNASRYAARLREWVERDAR